MSERAVTDWLRCAAASILLFCGVAAAARPVLLVNLWRMAPGQPSATTVVAKGKPVLSQRLLPTGLRAIDTDVTDPKSGKVLFAAGTQFFELAGEADTAWCDITPPGAPPPVPPRRGPPIHRCLLDLGRNDAGDAYFEITGSSYGLPTIFARKPNKMASIVPVTLRKLDPVQAQTEYRLNIVYWGARPLTGSFFFEAAAGVEGLEHTPLGSVSLKGDARPQTLKLQGATFTVIEADGKQATVRIDAPIAPGVFSAMRGLKMSGN